MLMNVVCFAFIYYAMIRAMFPAGHTFASCFARGRMAWTFWLVRNSGHTKMFKMQVTERILFEGEPAGARARGRDIGLVRKKRLRRFANVKWTVGGGETSSQDAQIGGELGIFPRADASPLHRFFVIAGDVIRQAQHAVKIEAISIEG
jgi:hypothetical protein